jgi:adenosylhomocysteine nucleosidase
MDTAEVGVLLFVAAQAREYDGVLRRMNRVRPAGAGIDFARRGELAGKPVMLVANGAGPRLASEAVEWASRRANVNVAVSTGYCGALDDGLRVGDIIIALQVYSPETGRRYRAESPECVPQKRGSIVASVDRFVGTVKEKRELRASGAVAVEMEAIAVAEEAEKRGWKFSCVRVVSDTANEGFDLDLNAARSDDGRFRTGRIVAAAMRRPVARIPELFRLMNSSQRAARALGDFLAECRF